MVPPVPAQGVIEDLAGAGATKDQLEEIVADESLGLIDHYRIVRAALYRGFSAAAELADSHSLTLLAGRLHENFRDCGRLTGELQRGPLLNVRTIFWSIPITRERSPGSSARWRPIRRRGKR